MQARGGGKKKKNAFSAHKECFFLSMALIKCIAWRSWHSYLKPLHT